MKHVLSIVFETPDDFVVEVGEHHIDVLNDHISDIVRRIYSRAYRDAKGVCFEKKKAQKKKKIW